MLGYVLPEDALEYNEEWEDHYPLEHFNLDFQKFEPRSVKLGSHIHPAHRGRQSP